MHDETGLDDKGNRKRKPSWKPKDAEENEYLMLV